jgi:hypothetical protein
MRPLDRFLQVRDETAKFAETLVGLPEEEAVSRTRDAGLHLEVLRPPSQGSFNWRAKRIRAWLDEDGKVRQVHAG